MRNRIEVYQKRKDRYEKLLGRQSKAANILSNIRLLVFLLGAGISVFLGVIGFYYLLITTVTASLILFLYLVLKHDRLLNRKNYSIHLMEINDNSLKRINGQWTGFPDDGREFDDENHNYTRDLDVFGKGSLFQWINTAATYMGRRRFVELLTKRPDNCQTILMRQEAVKELAEKLGWRQRLVAEGMLIKDKMKDPGFLIDWAQDKTGFYCRQWVVLSIRILPLFTIFLAATGLVFSLLPVCITAAAFLLLQYILLKLKGAERRNLFKIAESYHDELKVYHKMLKVLCKQRFKSAYLAGLGEKLYTDGKKSAYSQMERLAKIVDSISNRHTPFYFIFNMLVLWDFQNLIALEKWKDTAGRHLRTWFETIGEFEALSSIATVSYDHPDWAIPMVVEEGPGFLVAGMGHPLLSEKRVCNDLKIQIPTRALLVTGSNMSGKSTYLRTAGINLVLAYAGAPVCARSFSAILADIHTCMRVNDNLEKGISSFYSELIRIKKIVEAANSGKKVFFLLDEIFKGTNSIDRHTGAKVLIKKLCETDSFGLVSTHDLELCQLEGESDKIRNCHFQEHYDGDRICFDYKLRPGASTTRNAVYLMRMAGIDITDKRG